MVGGFSRTVVVSPAFSLVPRLRVRILRIFILMRICILIYIASFILTLEIGH